MAMSSPLVLNKSISSSIEARLQALEAVLGVKGEKAEKKDVERRLTELEQKIKSTTPSSLHATWDESDRLLKDLHPGSNLTYQQTSKK